MKKTRTFSMTIVGGDVWLLLGNKSCLIANKDLPVKIRNAYRYVVDNRINLLSKYADGTCVDVPCCLFTKVRRDRLKRLTFDAVADAVSCKTKTDVVDSFKYLGKVDDFLSWYDIAVEKCNRLDELHDYQGFRILESLESAAVVFGRTTRCRWRIYREDGDGNVKGPVYTVESKANLKHRLQERVTGIDDGLCDAKRQTEAKPYQFSFRYGFELITESDKSCFIRWLTANGAPVTWAKSLPLRNILPTPVLTDPSPRFQMSASEFVDQVSKTAQGPFENGICSVSASMLKTPASLTMCLFVKCTMTPVQVCKMLGTDISVFDLISVPGTPFTVDGTTNIDDIFGNHPVATFCYANCRKEVRILQALPGGSAAELPKTVSEIAAYPAPAKTVPQSIVRKAIVDVKKKLSQAKVAAASTPAADAPLPPTPYPESVEAPGHCFPPNTKVAMANGSSIAVAAAAAACDKMRVLNPDRLPTPLPPAAPAPVDEDSVIRSRFSGTPLVNTKNMRKLIPANTVIDDLLYGKGNNEYAIGLFDVKLAADGTEPRIWCSSALKDMVANFRVDFGMPLGLALQNAANAEDNESFFRYLSFIGTRDKLLHLDVAVTGTCGRVYRHIRGLTLRETVIPADHDRDMRQKYGEEWKAGFMGSQMQVLYGASTKAWICDICFNFGNMHVPNAFHMFLAELRDRETKKN